MSSPRQIEDVLDTELVVVTFPLGIGTVLLLFLVGTSRDWLFCRGGNGGGIGALRRGGNGGGHTNGVNDAKISSSIRNNNERWRDLKGRGGC